MRPTWGGSFRPAEQLPPCSVHKDAVEPAVKRGHVLRQWMRTCAERKWSQKTKLNKYAACSTGINSCADFSGLTYRDHQEAYVTEPVGCLVSELLHKEPKDGAEVTLVTCHRHLHCGWCLCIAVTAAKVKIETRNEAWTERDSKYCCGERVW